MRPEDMMEDDETFLWLGTPSPNTSFWETVFSLAHIAVIAWSALMLFFTYFVDGLSPLLFLWLLLLILPILVGILDILHAKQKALDTHYWVTTEGIYIQQEDQDVIFYPYSQFRTATVKQGIIDYKNKTGDVFCEYLTPFTTGYGKDSHTTYGVYLNNLIESQAIAQMIQDQIIAHSKDRCDECMTFRQDFEHIRKKPQTRSKPAASLHSSAAAANTAQQETQQAVTDPQEEFFGREQKMFRKKSDSLFLDLEKEEQRDILGNLPDESVSELQAELFGADAEQQDAFADPTVNPLPELPETPQDNEQGQFMQRGF